MTAAAARLPPAVPRCTVGGAGSCRNGLSTAGLSFGVPVLLPRAAAALPMDTKALLWHGQLLLTLRHCGVVVTAVINSAVGSPTG